MQEATQLTAAPVGASDLIVVVIEVDVPGPQPIALHEFIVARRSLILRVASQHALQAHTNALDVLYGTPALLTKQIEAYDAIRVDVRMYWYGSVG